MLSRVLFAACVLVFAATGIRAGRTARRRAKELVIHPKAVELRGPRDEQRVIVLGVWADGRKFDLTRVAKLTSREREDRHRGEGQRAPGLGRQHHTHHRS